MPETDEDRMKRLFEIRQRLLMGAHEAIHQGRTTEVEMVEILAQMTGCYLTFLGSMTNGEAMNFAISNILMGNKEAAKSLQNMGIASTKTSFH